MVHVSVVTPSDHSWQDTVAAHGDASLAHAPQWFTAIARAYGHAPLYLAAEAGSDRGVLPAFVVQRPLFGSVVTSMPFLDSGGPCGSPALARTLVERLTEEARRRGARHVEVRCRTRLAIDAPAIEAKVNMTLTLDRDPNRLWTRFDKSVRNQIRKAERSGLTVHAGGSANLATFYDAFAERMRDLGSPVHALGFLRAVVDGFGDRARVVLVNKGTEPVGGLVALAFKNRVVVPWATCRQEYFALCPNMLLYWDTIKRACADGFERFDFGRSTRNSGTYRFKRQWGAEEEPLFWYRFPLDARPQAAAHQGPGRGAHMLTAMWRRLPLTMTRQLGPRIRKYLTQ